MARFTEQPVTLTGLREFIIRKIWEEGIEQIEMTIDQLLELDYLMQDGINPFNPTFNSVPIKVIKG